MQASQRFICRQSGWGLVLFLLAYALATPAKLVLAQAPPPDYIPRGMDELQQLVAPIALYPDALLAQVLSASTYPDDVIAAAQWEDAGNNPQTADSQPWDSSVKGVARYPAILHYMASNGAWMNALGDSFLNQQGDVMSAVQNMRGDALAARTLTNTPQQSVINQDGYIQIIPSDPQYLYAPVYDPQIVYAPPQYIAGEAYPTYITFGPRVEVGDWLDFDLDWHDRSIYFGRWGQDRPWWHDRDHGGAYHYMDDRPGIYQPGRFRDTRGRPIEVQANHWTRDDRRPAPRRVPEPAARQADVRPNRGYPQRASGPGNASVQAPRGGDASRQSERGRTSRQQAAQPEQRQAPQQVRQAPQAQRAPEPVRQAPREAAPAREPVRQAPRQSAPAPEARPSAPTRGGAMGGYQNGAAASGSAARGAASRGRR
jgi:hypothetical protein